MIRRLSIFIFVLALLPTLLFAQNREIQKTERHILKPNGEVVKIDAKKGVYQAAIDAGVVPAGVTFQAEDTLRFTGEYNTNFGFFGQDVMIQWYKAPADIRIIAAGVSASDESGSALGGIELTLWNMNWTEADLLAAGVTNWGWYHADGNGFNDIGAFPIEATDGWVDHSGTGDTPPWDTELWGDAGTGFPIVPVAVGVGGGVYQWAAMDVIGEPEVTAGSIVAVVVTHMNPSLDDAASARIGWWSAPGTGYNGWKFYRSGRSGSAAIPDSASFGWWSRAYSWDFPLAIEYLSDPGPVFQSIPTLGTTVSTDPRTVATTITDINPFGAEGVASASLFYQVEGGGFTEVPMTNTSGDVWEGEIGGATFGETVEWYLTATDVEGNPTTTLTFSYAIFQPQEDVLFIYNVADFGESTARFWYMDQGNIPHDYWSVPTNGASEMPTVLGFYDYVVQVDGSFPSADLSSAVAGWLGSRQADKGYLFSSQDYGCLITGTCADITFAAGDFEFDYLGISGITSQDFHTGPPAQINPVAGDVLSGWVDTYNNDSSVTFWYDPAFETGFTAWTDNIDVGDGTAIFAEESTGNTVGVRHEGAGWKTAFLTMDYLANNFRTDTSLAIGDDPGYAWGVTVEGQSEIFLTWAGWSPTGVKEVDNLTPEAFVLKQNYPNPFNPSTIIKFSVPQNVDVNLKVYDVLGKEVATLVNKNMQAGNYEVDFDASKLASGMYIYQLKAGSFVGAKKMMLLK